MNRQRGMTMVELLVSIAIVMVVIGTATTAYLKILRTYKTHGRLAEGYMANLTGLEMLRYDIEMAGFGLPASMGGAAYSEANDSTVHYYNPADLNDSPNGVPRAFVLLNPKPINPPNLPVATLSSANSSAVLTIKSTAANINATSKKWSMIMNTGTPIVKLWGVNALDPVMDFTQGDNFIILDYNGVLQPAGAWSSYTFNASQPNTGYYNNASTLPTPATQKYVYYMYGLDNNNGNHTMPFNRVDYYLDKILTDFPKSSCAASTYTLYRTTIDQATGKLINKAPLVDCVRDFEVAFGIDPGGDPAQQIVWQQSLVNPDGSAMPATGPLSIQQQLREVRVFVLYQEGLGDTSIKPDFRFSTAPLTLGDPDTPTLSTWTPSGPDLQYRWKVIEIAVKPTNLLNLSYR
jgi:type II secretory pathway pseudopilin PulG